MRSSPLSRVVALDGGTSNTRARLLHQRRVTATAARAVGVRDSVVGAGGVASAVREVIGEVLSTAGGARPDLIIAAGMLSSEVGLAAVPHAIAPASVDDLACGARLCRVPEAWDDPILIIPGVRTPPAEGVDGWTEADVMRGEECETFGARMLRNLEEPAAFVWPGSHTKLVLVDKDGRIVASHTTLAGELMSAVASHTLIASSLPHALPTVPDPDAIARGVRIVARDGLGRAAFLVRIAALTHTMSAEQRAAFWIGAVVAEDAAHLARHPILSQPLPILVGGRQPLRDLYAAQLAERHPAPVEALTDDENEHASALGALAIAQRHVARGTSSGETLSSG